MKKKGKLWTIIAGIFIGGLTYWRIPYAEMNMIDLNYWLLIGVGAIIGACLSTIFFHQKPFSAGLFITLGVVLSVLFRIIYDTVFWDASSHSLAGIEVVIACLQSLPPALIGAYAGVIFKKSSSGNQN